MPEELFNIPVILCTLVVFAAGIVFIQNSRRSKRERELDIYYKITKEYRDFLKLCLAYPTFNTDTLNHSECFNLSEEQKKQHYILYEYLASILESAYLQLSNPKTRLQKVYWNDWNSRMQGWMWRDDFVKVWKEGLWINFNEDFSKHMNSLEFWRCGTVHPETLLSE